MPQLIIIYDPTDPPLTIHPSVGERVKQVSLPLASDLKPTDIYDISRRLADLLLEQAVRD